MENGHLGSWTQSRIVFLYLGLSLARLSQPAGVGPWLEQPGEGFHSWEGEEMAQPRQLCGELSACNFCAALERVSLGKQGLTLDFQTFGGRRLWERGGVWGAG